MWIVCIGFLCFHLRIWYSKSKRLSALSRGKAYITSASTRHFFSELTCLRFKIRSVLSHRSSISLLNLLKVAEFPFSAAKRPIFACCWPVHAAYTVRFLRLLAIFCCSITFWRALFASTTRLFSYSGFRRTRLGLRLDCRSETGYRSMKIPAIFRLSYLEM